MPRAEAFLPHFAGVGRQHQTWCLDSGATGWDQHCPSCRQRPAEEAGRDKRSTTCAARLLSGAFGLFKRQRACQARQYWQAICVYTGR